MYRSFPHRLRSFCAVLLSLALPAAAAAETHSFTLSEALDAAREADPAVRRAALDVARARGDAEARWNLLLPDLELGGTLSRASFEEEPLSPWSAGFSASASLGLSPALDRRMAARSQALEAAVIELQRAEVELARRVQERFYAVLLEQRRIAIAEQNVALAGQQLERVRARYEQGRASELELLEARAAAIGRRPELLSRRRSLFTERAALKDLIGLTPEDKLEVVGEIAVGEPELEAADIREALLAGSLERAADRLAVERAETTRAVTARDTFLPRLSASYGYSPRLSPAFEAGPWQDGETWRTGTLSLRVTLPLDPLIPGSAGDRSVESEELAVERARVTLSETEAGLRRDAADLAERLALSRERLGLLREALEIARARYEQTLLAYESGGVELLDVEDARTALEEAELDVLQERYTITMTLVELDALAGGTMFTERVQ